VLHRPHRPANDAGVATPDPDDEFRPNADELIAHNAKYVEQFADQGLQVEPRRQLAIVACMDSRMDIFEMLGLAHGDAHVIRNAGGVVTDDVVRSLVLSQLYLGTREILLIHHTDCGLQKTDDTSFRKQLDDEFGLRPSWALEAFTDPYADVRQNISRVRNNPFVRHKDHIRGFVYRVEDGRLDEVAADPRF
jgi:carbonic anhydrase